MTYYKKHAARLSKEYNSLDPERVHASWRHLLPVKPGLACDIGAGSGRDANWLATMGWDVVAVEPCRELREEGQRHSHSSVTWIDDSLPELARLRAVGYRFDLILISAVWMHLPATQRERAFRIISELLAAGGKLVITLRHGSDEEENKARGFHAVSVEELQSFARQRALAIVHHDVGDTDAMGRDNVSWETICFELPDDGTGSLPLLRHIIVNDDKAATYKLGLLRTLLRIAEGAPGMVLQRTDEFVDIPFGLVALYWLKLYMPLLLTHDLQQHPNASLGYGFAKEDFYMLVGISPFDLRVGAGFVGDEAQVLVGAIRTVCMNIRDMPARYITYPGQDEQVFECTYSSVNRKVKAFQLNKETLARFGTFRIPANLWQTLGQYACWIEPAIVNEWAGLMSGWQVRYDSELVHKALVWEEGKRDTSRVRQRIDALKSSGDVRCVWSNADLSRRQYEVDHCFPWSRWSNNDYWNLMPTTVSANGSKREKLPSASLMHTARPRIVQWWEMAYAQSDMSERFFMEAESALPLLDDGCRDLGDIFEAMQHQRTKLKANQQLAEWEWD